MLKTQILAAQFLLIVIALPVHAESQKLADTYWVLTRFQSMDDAIGEISPLPEQIYTMVLRANGTVLMQLNCNRAHGTWQASGNDVSGQFSFGPLAVTRALCPPPDPGEQFARQSEYIRSYLFRDGNLHLSLMADGGIYSWEPDLTLYNSADEQGVRNWEVRSVQTWLNLREQPTTASSVVSRYSNATLLDNLGCQRNGGRYWCEVQELGGGPRGYVAADYLKPAISPDGTAARGMDDSALRAGQRDFDATGKLPCALVKDESWSQCEFAVARSGGGYATLMISQPDGGQRIVLFRMGRATSASVSEAEGAAQTF